MKYAFIKDNKQHFPVSRLCQVLDISSSGYYAWLKRPASLRDEKNLRLDKKIIETWNLHEKRYGAPRITLDLIDQGEICSENRIAKRMKAMGIKAIAAKKFKVTTDSKHKLPIAENLLKQDFTASKPNEKWVSDITYIWTQSGWLYLAAVMDLYSRAIIGWSMGERMNKQLVCDALTMALKRRDHPKSTIIHSDKGSQYCSKQYQQLITDNQLVCSMSGTGNCFDNAAMESFFHTLKVELVHRQDYATREDAKKEIFRYIEAYYNTIRRHSTIGYVSPMNYEKQVNAL